MKNSIKRTLFSVCRYQTTGSANPLMGGAGSLSKLWQVNPTTLFSFPARWFASRRSLIAQIDWDRQAGKLYVIVDPLDPDGILYLSEKEYTVERRIAVSNDVTLEVLARPGSKRPSPSEASSSDDSLNSPHSFDRLSERLPGKSRFGSVRQLFPKFSEEGMVSLTRGNTRELFLRWGYTLLFWAGSNTKRRSYKIIALATRIDHMREKYGTKGVVRCLKATMVLVLQYLSGSPSKNSLALGWPMKLRNGLPAWLPLPVRHEIRRGNTKWIRIILSILNSYKAIKCVGQVDLSSITAPSWTEESNDQNLLQEFKSFCKRFWASVPVKPSLDGEAFDNFPLVVKAGANHSLAFLDAIHSLRAYEERPEMKEKLLTLLENQGQSGLANFIRGKRGGEDPDEDLGGDLFSSLSSIASHLSVEVPHPLPDTTKPSILGKLATKEEAAGKVRVFAIVDYWTQRLSAPWHDLFFKILRSLEAVDGTFDQDALVTRMKERNFPHAFSYDLKSATDMIPLELYLTLFKEQYGQPAVDWLRFIVDRDFRIPLNKATKADYGQVEDGTIQWDNHMLVRYTRGQPMGCLGSWASLALVHHAIVRWAMERAGKDITLPLYGVLGDDIVIFDPAVAEQYLLICKGFGIPIGLPKSFVSTPNSSIVRLMTDEVLRLGDWDPRPEEPVADLYAPTQTLGSALFNFANQTYKGNVCLSVISLKEELACATPFMRIEMAARLVRRGWTDGSFAQAVRLLFGRVPWLRAQSTMSKGLLPHSFRTMIRLALSPEVSYFGGDKASRLWMWFRVSQPGIHFLSDASMFFSRVTSMKGPFSSLPGWNSVQLLKKGEKKLFSRALYAHLWVIRDSIMELRKITDAEMAALTRLVDEVPKVYERLFERLRAHLLDVYQHPSGRFVQLQTSHCAFPDEKNNPPKVESSYLEKLDQFLQTYVPTVKAPYVWMLFTAANALQELGYQTISRLSPPPPFGRVLEFLRHAEERRQESLSKWGRKNLQTSPASFLKANLAPVRKSRVLALEGKAISGIFRRWNLLFNECGAYSILTNRDNKPYPTKSKKPTTTGGVVPTGATFGGFYLKQKKK